MRYIVVSASEWVYPDRFAYASGSQSVRLDSACGGLVGVQLLLKDIDACPAVSFSVEGASADFFEMIAVPVRENVRIETPAPHCPEREAPFYVYDCLKPYAEGFAAAHDAVALYVRVKAPEQAGAYRGEIKLGETSVPVELTVYAAAVPAETFQNVYWYSKSGIALKHGLAEDSAEADAMEEKYLKLMRYMRQTVLAVSHPKVTDLGDNKYAFDFTRTRFEVERARRLGFQTIQLSPFAGRRSWQEPELYTHGLNVMTYEGYCYIRQFLSAVRDFMQEMNLAGKLRMGVSDEPTPANEVTYRALAGLVNRYCPEAILTDAMSYCNVHGSINTYVPLNAEYQRHQKEFETFRAAGDEIWQYVCCGPRGDGFINRFLDYPLLSTRYQYWGNYAFNLTGYLHWAFFQPQPGQDLFTTSCPEHHNADSVGFLPDGDTHLCYNGDNGPWMSVRLEQLRQSAEEYEWLRLLDAREPEKARALCAKVFRAFDDVEYDPNAFDAARRELLAAVQ